MRPFRIQQYDVDLVLDQHALETRLGHESQWGWSVHSSAIRCPHPEWYASRIDAKTPLWILTTHDEHTDAECLEGKVPLHVTLFMNWPVDEKDGSGHAYTSVATAMVYADSLSMVHGKRTEFQISLKDVTNQEGASIDATLVLVAGDSQEHTQDSVERILETHPPADRSSFPMVAVGDDQETNIESWRKYHMPHDWTKRDAIKWQWTAKELEPFGEARNIRDAIFVPRDAHRPSDALVYFLR